MYRHSCVLCFFGFYNRFSHGPQYVGVVICLRAYLYYFVLTYVRQKVCGWRAHPDCWFSKCSSFFRQKRRRNPFMDCAARKE